LVEYPLWATKQQKIHTTDISNKIGITHRNAGRIVGFDNGTDIMPALSHDFDYNASVLHGEYG
jgi:hypothetical protein